MLKMIPLLAFVAAAAFGGAAEAQTTLKTVQDRGSLICGVNQGLEGFAIKDVPAATYAVFRIVLDGSALHPQVGRAMAEIWGELIPAGRLRVAEGPNFERYDVEPEHFCCGFGVFHFQHGLGIADIEDNAQSVELRDSFTQEFDPLAGKISRLKR